MMLVKIDKNYFNNFSKSDFLLSSANNIATLLSILKMSIQPDKELFVQLIEQTKALFVKFVIRMYK